MYLIFHPAFLFEAVGSSIHDVHPFHFGRQSLLCCSYRIKPFLRVVEVIPCLNNIKRQVRPQRFPEAFYQLPERLFVRAGGEQTGIDGIGIPLALRPDNPLQLRARFAQGRLCFNNSAVEQAQPPRCIPGAIISQFCQLVTGAASPCCRCHYHSAACKPVIRLCKGRPGTACKRRFQVQFCINHGVF